MSSRSKRRKQNNHGCARNNGGGNSRGMLTRLVKNENAVIRNIHQAVLFLDGMNAFTSKSELLSMLDDNRFFGKERIEDLLSFIATPQDVNTFFIPLIQHIVNDETSRPLYSQLRNRILLKVYLVPDLINTLRRFQYPTDTLTTQKNAKVLCVFLLVVSKAFIDARKSETVRDLAVMIRKRGDVEEADVLCAVILVDKKDEESGQPTSLLEEQRKVSSTAAAYWVTDKTPPGGRHDNDHYNFRNINLVPTLEELQCEQKPWLPLATKENMYTEDQNTQLLDANFRLLREDAVHTMKTNIQEQQRPWPNARIIGINCMTPSKKGKGGISSLSFTVQMALRPTGSKNIDWKRSRALARGSIVALCRDGKPCRIGVISVREDDKKGDGLDYPYGPKIGVQFDSSEGDFNESLKEMTRNSVINERLIKLLKQRNSTSKKPLVSELDEKICALMDSLASYDLIEASKSFFTYRPILKALKTMETVPFAEELVNLRASGRPVYLPDTMTMPNDPCFRSYVCDLQAWSSQSVTDNTSLDISQADAVKHALSSRVGLIQGPPGTGKTFIGALVARMIRENTDESILCVCYTNHALDQFLEHMISSGENSIVRIGGRSKSEKLAKYQLRELSRHKSDLNSNATRRLNCVIAQLHKCHDLIVEKIKLIESDVSWKAPLGGIRDLLSLMYPDVLEYLELPEMAEGFTPVGPDNKKIKDAFLFKVWKNGDNFPSWLDPHMEDTLSPQFLEFWSMPSRDREATIEKWRNEIFEQERLELNEHVRSFNQLSEEKQSILREKDLQVLNAARVIGATTSGAAEFRDILSAKSAGVVLVEEAGEVLEAHVLAALSEATNFSRETKHLILIGDHEQLRPKVENYSLTTVSGGGYNFDCSLFERLVKKLPSVTLQVQHRMRPEISEFVRHQTYPNLEDHQSVQKFPDLKGVSKNIVFIDHHEREDGSSSNDDNQGTTKTKSNAYEAELCIEIVRYFLLQGYRHHQIVVLTPYVGQLLKLSKFMKMRLKETSAYISDLDQREIEDLNVDLVDQASNHASEKKGVRCSSIDNFQGEEADIVIISLVRSNNIGNIGFLKEKQRVNVLLSRARYGMFIVGNKQTILQSTKGRHVWAPLFSLLEERDQIMSGLPTTCQLHPDDEGIVLSEPCHFRQYRPNGGCTRPCQFRMECGHACHMTCHSVDQGHYLAQKECSERCRRFPPECKLNHACPKLCRDNCGECNALVGPTKLPCGHIDDNPRCHDVRNEDALIEYSKKCQKIVKHDFANCNHTVETRCSNATRENPICPAKCDKPMDCGHKCASGCGVCDGNHSCDNSCARPLFCGHVCGRKCHAPNGCEPCKERCSVRCIHSKCNKACHEPCPSCIEPCDWHCEHKGSCALVCGAPCSRLPCNERCSKVLECGHQCPSVCGEICPPAKDYCQICCDDTMKDKTVDFISLSTYGEHDIDNDPVIILPCGHLYSISTLDGHMNMKAAYATSNEDDMTYVNVKPLITADLQEKPMVCPECRADIHSIKRYGRILQHLQLRSLERKHMMSIDRSIDTLQEHLSSKNTSSKNTIKRLVRIKHAIEKGPMWKVYEACGASDEVNVPPPPVLPLIRALGLMAKAYSKQVTNVDDKSYVDAKEMYTKVISLAFESKSNRSCAILRLEFVRFLIEWNSISAGLKPEVITHLDSIINHEVKFDDLVEDAKLLKKHLIESMDKKTIASIVSAMSIGGYDYGTNWNSHWYECPNGHPYFIGECGGAMEASSCNECGERIGGGSHRLIASNRAAGGVIREILQGRR